MNAGIERSTGFARDHLQNPDFFPARIAGAPWGKESVTCRFVGGDYAVSGLHPAQADAVRERFGALAAGERPVAPVAFEVFVAEPEDFLPIRRDGSEYRLGVDYDEDAVRLSGHRLMGLLDRRDGLRAALWTSTREPAPFLEAFENVLRVVAAYQALDAGAVLVHSAALASEGQVVLCPGRSGAGKSTLSGLAENAGWTVLSDELNALAAGPPATVEQVPFAGDHGQVRRVAGPLPLAAVCRLRQSAEEGIRPIGPGVVAAQLLAASPYVNRDPWRSAAAEEILGAVAATTPGWELAFTRSSDLAMLEPLVPVAREATA